MKTNKKFDNYKCITICLLLFNVLGAKAQTNYVPNFDFSDGRSIPKCIYDYSSGGPGNIETDIYFWFNAKENPNCREGRAPLLRKCTTADWIDSSCGEYNPIPFTNSSRIIRLLAWDATFGKRREGVGVRLPFKLPAGKYILRFKVAVSKEDSGDNLAITTNLTKWETGWNSNKKGNVRMKDLGTFNMGGKSFRWHIAYIQFEVSQNKSGEMDVLTVVRNFTSQSTSGESMYIDQVELYAYCAPYILFQSRHFNMVDEFPYEAEVIKAGSHYLNWWPEGDVVVEDTVSMAKFKASKEVILKDGFTVERGGRFHAWIAPCGLLCPFPLADPGKDTTVCGRGCIDLGGPDRYGITNEWASKPEGALQYLSSTSIPNPTFCPPIGAGRIRYYVKATNNCNQSWTDDVIVDYDSDPDPNPYFTVNNLDLSDSLNFDLVVSPHTETIKVEIMTCANVVLKTYEYDNGDDFDCCSFYYKVDQYFNSCQCYKVKISTKNFCYPYWKDTVINWPRNTAYNFIAYSNYACKNIVYSWEGYLNMVVTGATYYNIDIRDRDNYSQYTYTGICEDDTIALWHPNVTAGTYYVNLYVYDCGNIPHFYTYPVVVFDNCQLKKSMDDIWVHPLIYTPPISNRLRVSLYPNPSTGIVALQGYLGKSDQLLSVEIYDIMGHPLKYELIESNSSGILNKEIDLSSLKDGIYFVNLKYDKISEMKRLVLIK